MQSLLLRDATRQGEHSERTTAYSSPTRWRCRWRSVGWANKFQRAELPTIHPKPRLESRVELEVIQLEL